MKVASNAREEVLNEIEDLSHAWDIEREDFIDKLVKCRDKLQQGKIMSVKLQAHKIQDSNFFTSPFFNPIY